jgi:glycosyltransferase involved in cell wall biosynthesis
MRIALLSTCAVSTPPKAYGGTELVLAELAKGLVALGHEVTVFATGNSEPAGELRFYFHAPVWPPDDLAELRHETCAWHDIVNASPAFDVVHCNHPAAVSLQRVAPLPTVLTLHGDRAHTPVDLYRASPEVDYVAVSQRQAELVPELAIASVIHHGLDPEHYPAGEGDGGFAAFLGRLAPEKAPHSAIEAALDADVPLRLAGGPHAADGEYFTHVVKPLLDRHSRGCTWLGELGHASKVELLRGATALLFPLAWEEPFGLVMIEAMMVGTPVLAFRRGSAPEVVEDGVTGYLVDSVDEMAWRLRGLRGFDRRRCRGRALARWSHLRMAREYERAYRRVVEKRAVPLARGRHGWHAAGSQLSSSRS